MAFSLYLLALSLSLDALGVGIAYGLRKIKIPLMSIICISAFSILYSGIAIYFGKYLNSIIPAEISKLIGVFILLIVGVWIILQGLIKTRPPHTTAIGVTNTANVANTTNIINTNTITVDNNDSAKNFHVNNKTRKNLGGKICRKSYIALIDVIDNKDTVDNRVAVDNKVAIDNRNNKNNKKTVDNSDKKYIKNEELLKIAIKSLGITIQVLRDPFICDMDKSGVIDIKESFLLGFALSVDAIGVGIGSVLSGYYSVFLPFAIGFFQLVLLRAGIYFGGKMIGMGKVNERLVAIVSGIILIILAIIRIK